MIQSFIVDQGQIKEDLFAINDLERSEITCINFHTNSKIFFCGHNSGSISAWNISPETKFLKCSANSKIHDDCINSIFFKDNFIITSSSDHYLKVFNLDNSFENVLSKNFESVFFFPSENNFFNLLKLSYCNILKRQLELNFFLFTQGCLILMINLK